MDLDTAKRSLGEAATAVEQVAPLSSLAGYALVAAALGLGWLIYRRWRGARAYEEDFDAPLRATGPRLAGLFADVGRYLESDDGRRHWNGVVGVWQRLFTGGKLSLALLASVVLTLASFYTTWNGMSYFLGGTMVALLAASAIQIILFIASWLIAESSAGKLSIRMRARSPLLSPFDKERAQALVARSRVWAPALFLMALFVSVFFSFDALFDKVYQPAEQLLNNLKVARSTVASVFTDVRGRIDETRKATVGEFASGPEWRRWSGDLDKILAVGEASRALIQESRDRDLAKAQTRLATLRDALEKKTTDAADLEGRLKVAAHGGGSATQEFADLQDRVKQLTQSAAEMQADIDAATKARDDIQANRDTEASAGGLNPNGTRRAKIKGPVWHKLNDDLIEANTRLSAKKTSLQKIGADLAKAKKDLETATSRAGELKAQLDARRGEIEALKAEIAQANLQSDDLTDTGGLLAGADARAQDRKPGGPGREGESSDVVKSIREAEQAFLGAGSPAAFDRMFAGCSELTAVLKKNDVTAPKVAGLTCDASTLAPKVDRLRALDAASSAVEGACVVDDGFNAAPSVAALAQRGGKCLAASALPEDQIAADRERIDRVVAENSPQTTHFVRAIATLRRFDPLAWLALGIAAIIDLLVLAAAMLGARANVTPLSDVFLSGQDHEENDIAEHVDTRIYSGDSPDMVNKKLALAFAQPVAGADPEEEAYFFAFSLADVPGDYRGNVRSLLYYWISKHLVKVDIRDPHLYLMQQPLIRHLTHAIGRYERNLKQKRGRREGRRVIFSPGGADGAEPAASASESFDPAQANPQDIPDNGPSTGNVFAARGYRRGPRPID